VPKIRTPENLIDEMPLRKLIGQTLGASLEDLHPERSTSLVEERYLGTLVFPARGVKTNEEARKITEGLQVAAINAQAGIPLFICSEQEPGLRMLPPPATDFPTYMALASCRSTRYCYDLAFAMALELRSIGVNMEVAPSVDINRDAGDARSIYSFGEDPVLVAKLSSTYVRGLQHGGVSAVAKNFPTRGDAVPDGGDNRTAANPTEKPFSVELRPFLECMRVGIDAVLLGRTEVPDADPSMISALSFKTVTGLLRNRLGFSGLAVADLRGFGVDHQIARMALEAGNDLVLVGDDALDKCLEDILTQAKKSRVFARRAREAALRVLKLKSKRLNRFRRPSLTTYGAAMHTRLAQQIANNSITVIRNNGAIPIRRESPVLLICPTQTRAGDTGIQSMLFDAMKRHCRLVRDNPVDLNPGKDEIERAVDQAKKDRSLVIGTVNAHLYRGQCDLARRCLEVNPSSVVVSMANPYDLKSIPAKNAIATYGQGDFAIRAAAAVLYGQLRPLGITPIAFT
jgi:beta-N-acetylhexosaminidase